MGAVCLDGGLLVGMTAAPAMSAYANALLRVHVGVTTQRAPAQYRFKRSAFKVTALMVRVRALGEAAAGKYWTAGAHCRFGERVTYGSATAIMNGSLQSLLHLDD